MYRSRLLQRFFYPLCIGIILIVAGLFRYWDLESAPPGLQLDEAAYGNDAIEVAETGQWSVFYPDNYGREGLFINLVAIVFKFFGVGVVQLRFVSATAGVLTVLGLYFFVKHWTDRNIALVSSFLLAVSFWDVMFSRIAFRGSLSPLFLVWGLFALSRALERKRMIDWVITGIVFGLGLYTYLAFRAIIFLLPLIALYPVFRSAYTSRRWQRWYQEYGKGWMIAAVAMFVSVIPLLIYFISHPGQTVSRALPISVFVDAHPILTFFKNVVLSIGILFYRGDPAWQHNIAHRPELLLPVIIFFFIGLFILATAQSSARDRLFRWILLCTWLVMLLPGALTTEYLPHSLRTINILIPVYTICGIGAVALYRWVIKTFLDSATSPVIPFMLGCILLVMIGVAEAQKYFVHWAQSPEAHCRALDYHVALADEINQMPEETHAYVIVDVPGIPMDGTVLGAQTLMFLTHASGNASFYTPEQARNIQIRTGDRIFSLAEIEKQHEDCPPL